MREQALVITMIFLQCLSAFRSLSLSIVDCAFDLAVPPVEWTVQRCWICSTESNYGGGVNLES